MNQWWQQEWAKTRAQLEANPRLRIGEVSVTAGSRPARVGRQLAGGIQRGLLP